MMGRVPSEFHVITDAAKAALFRRGVELFNRRQFFECHEVLEEIWTPARGPERLFLQALIHFAVGFYHHRRGNQAGAERQLRKGLKKISPYLPYYESVNTEKLKDAVTRRLKSIVAGRSFPTYPRIQLSQPSVRSRDREGADPSLWEPLGGSNS